MGPQRLLIVGLALMAFLISASSVAAAAPAPLAFNLTFRPIARGAQPGLSGSGPYLNASGRYVGFTAITAAGPQFVVLDDLTGKRILAPPGCAGPMGGRAWVICLPASSQRAELFNLRTRKLRQLPLGCFGLSFVGTSQVVCLPPSGGYELYSLATRKLRRLPCNGLCQQDYYFQNVMAVGDRWFAVDVDPHEPCGDAVHYICGPETYDYYNTRTGRQQVPVVASSQTVDLNAPTLTRPLCAPLVEPPGYSPTTFNGWGLRFEGNFAIAQEPSGIYVERCGSELQLPLVEPPYEGTLIELPRAVAFCSSAIDGFLLPSLRPFTIDAPSFSDGLSPVCPLLAPRHAYAIDAQGKVWAAPLPRQLQDLAGSGSRRHNMP